jgi:hypothetical protein
MELRGLRTGTGCGAEKKCNSVGDWVATFLVCIMFIGMLSAMLFVLIGDAR